MCGTTHRRRFGSLRLRLTAVAAAAVAIVLTATAVAVTVIQRQQLTANLDASLEQLADAFETDFAIALPPAPLATNVEDLAIQLVDERGAILASSANLADAMPLQLAPEPGRVQSTTTRSDLPLEDDAYRILSRHVDTAAGPAVLHVAENADDLNGALSALRTTLAVTVPLVVALLAMLTWWLTGRTLAPVVVIRAEVDAISPSDTRRRVHVPAGDDEIARLAATMNRMLERLDRAAVRQRRFVADAAHELRTPLTRIRTNVEVDLAQPDRADHVATGRAVRDEVVDLQHLIDDLLHLARSDSGQTTEDHQPLDLDDVVLAEIRNQRAISDVAIDASGVSAAHLAANREQVARAVRNLLSNATRHARSVVTVTLVEGDDAIVLTIADDGPGVPPDQRDRIFERFARLDDARARDEGGTGLGLAITKDIVERHRGTVSCDDGPRGGARFRVTLPR